MARRHSGPAALLVRTAGASATPIAAGGAVLLASMPLLVALADATPGTVAVFRFLLALPLLAPLLLAESRAAGRRDPAARRAGLMAGVVLAADIVLWHQAIADSGAGIATVVANAQVVILPLLVWGVAGERPSARFALAVPLMLAGVALAGGIGDAGAYGPDPARGTLLALASAALYAVFLFLLRRAGDVQLRVVAPVWESTLGGLAAAILLGIAWQGIDLTPSLGQLGWMAALAIVGQVVGWLLIAAALPRLAASVGASLLLLQPAASVVLAALLLGERPSATQLVGCAIVIAAIALAAIGVPPRTPGVRRRTRGGGGARAAARV